MPIESFSPRYADGIDIARVTSYPCGKSLQKVGYTMSSLQISQGTFRLSDTKTLNIEQLCVQAGESWAFVGSNGSGKSALARALSGELTLLSGQRECTFSRITRLSFEQLQKLVTVAMPYGKHKGRLIADLPGNYLNWFAREGFPKGELGRLLALMHEIDHNGLSDLLKPLREAR